MSMPPKRSRASARPPQYNRRIKHQIKFLVLLVIIIINLLLYVFFNCPSRGDDFIMFFFSSSAPVTILYYILDFIMLLCYRKTISCSAREHNVYTRVTMELTSEHKKEYKRGRGKRNSSPSKYVRYRWVTGTEFK